jgi:NADPH:quinone reductase-like Zn-dependent oxidoreductase
MKAWQLVAENTLKLADLPQAEPAAGEVAIALKAAALNHRDVWIKQGQYAGVRYPCVPGSDGAGVVVAVGEGVDRAWLGREAIVNPSFGWGDGEAAQGPDFAILGLPRAGTLAERIAVPAIQVSPKPAHLSWEEAAALPLAGLTAYRSLFSRAGLRAGERLLISGIGGGVAQLALVLAVAAGAEVWVTSSSPAKLDRARALGAKGGYDYTRAGWVEAAKADGLFDVILDSAGGEGFDDLIELTKPGARLVFFGATRGNPPRFPLRKLYWRQLSLLGSTMGSPRDWRELLDFVARHGLRPSIDEAFPWERAPEAFARMERGEQSGKLVLRIGAAD